MKLTCSLLFLFELLILFLVFRLCVKVIVAVLGEFPLVALVHQIRSTAREVDIEFLNVDFHDTAVNCHTHLRENGTNSDDKSVHANKEEIPECCKWQ